LCLNAFLKKLNGCKRTGISWSMYYCKEQVI
jgi:hypothetical protein